MYVRKLHYYSGITIAVFVCFHLVNHLFSLAGIDEHIKVMQQFRKVYRHPLAEIILLTAVFIQVVSGVQQFRQQIKLATGFYERLQCWSGLYLAFFFLIHLSAVMVGRWLLELDTNFYFGAAGLNRFPFNLFFIPYYSLAILSFFAHIASIHYRKMKEKNKKATLQARLIIFLSSIMLFLLMYGLTHKFQGIDIPVEYGILIGK